MKSLRLVLVMILVLAGLAVHTAAGAENAKEQTSATKILVGTFDSRAIAVAYARSENFMQYIKGLKTELEKAKTEGNEKRVKELETLGPALQETLHKQGFSTWPVDDILKQIKDRIPDIARQAGVDVIVSKWDIVFQQSGIEFIDVTDFMVMPFNPTKETLQTIEEFKKMDPVTLEELKELGPD